MPAYVPHEELAYYPDIPHGTLHDTTFYSRILDNTRPIQVYVPPGYHWGDSCAVVVFHDGPGFVTMAPGNNALDFLISQKRIPKVIGILVPPVNRDPEYVGNQQEKFAAFIATELMPFVDSRFATRRSPSARATVGISNGGNIALLTAYLYPQVFGNAGSFSGAIQSGTLTTYRDQEPLPLRIYADVGTYGDLLNIAQSYHQVLHWVSYTHQYNEWPEGHNWSNWVSHLDNALLFFDLDRTDPSEAVDEKNGSIPRSFGLQQNYPNPFNPKTVVSSQLPVVSNVKLVVYDVLGREVAVLVNERRAAGRYEDTFDASGLASGVYIYRLTAGSFVESRKMILLK